MKTLSLYRQIGEDKHLLFKEIAVAKTYFRRLWGLLGHRSLNQEQGLLIQPCRRIHTLGMRFPIDVIFLDRQGVILKVVHALKPCRQAGAFKAHYTLELAAGSAQQHNLHLGDILQWD